MYIPILVPSVNSNRIEHQLDEIKENVGKLARKQNITLDCVLHGKVTFYESPSSNPVCSCPYYRFEKCTRHPCKEDTVKGWSAHTTLEWMSYSKDRRCLLLDKLAIL